MSKRDYYETLGVAKGASESDIKQAYRRLAMKYHPDRNQNDAEAESRFKEAKEAYDILGNPEKRSRYDRFGFAGVENSNSGFHTTEDLNDIFGGIFSDFSDIFGSGRRSSRPAQGSHLRYSMELELEEAVNGVEKEIRVPTKVVCESCSGSGAKKGTSPQTCSTCNGRGQVQMQQLGFSLRQTCPQCHGAGTIITDPCHDCNGHGFVQKSVFLSVQVPPGIDHGDQVRIAGKGEAGPNGAPPGDLYVQISLRRHSIFERDGDDLYCKMPISITTATLGGTLELPTLDGRAKIKIQPETQTGKVMRLRGKGVRNVRSRAVGDLYCKLVIETPVSLTAKQKALLKELDDSLEQGGARHNPRLSNWSRRIKLFWDKYAA